LPGCIGDLIASTTFYLAIAPFVVWLALLGYTRWFAGDSGPSQLMRIGHYRRFYHERHAIRCGALPPPSLLARIVLRAASEHSLLRLFQPLQWTPRPPHTRVEQLSVLLAVLQMKAAVVAFVFLPGIAAQLPPLPLLGGWTATALVAALVASLLQTPLRLLVDRALARRGERAMREPIDADGMTERHVLARALVSNFDARHEQHHALVPRREPHPHTRVPRPACPAGRGPGARQLTCRWHALPNLAGALPVHGA